MVFSPLNNFLLVMCIYNNNNNYYELFLNIFGEQIINVVLIICWVVNKKNTSWPSERVVLSESIIPGSDSDPIESKRPSGELTH